jgi:hypothetical protein
MSATLRAVDAPLASYIRPGRNDHLVLLQLAAEDRLGLSGLVVDPTLIARHDDLIKEAQAVGTETVLDPRAADLASDNGLALSGVADLPWAPQSAHRLEDLEGPGGLLFAEGLAEFAVKENLTAVLAPTHVLSDADDDWLAVDATMVGHLRRALDSRTRSHTPIYYPLIVRSSVVANAGQRLKLMTMLRSLPIDAVWLRVHPFGTNASGPIALRRYVEACQDFHRLGVPLVAERTGTVGVALLAVGAVGGIESGVTLGERFSLDRYTRPSRGGGFLPPPRVYLAALGAFLTRDQAQSFFEHRGMRSAFGCQDPACCRRGIEDMVQNPRRHFVVRRAAEIGRLSRTPKELRPTIYMDEFLRPASDAVVRARRAEPSLESAQRRLDSWRGTLGALLASNQVSTYSLVPDGRRVRIAE